MTSALTYKLSPYHKENIIEIKKLKSKVMDVLERYSKEYLNFLDQIDQQMYCFLYESLEHWRNKLNNVNVNFKRFEEVKIVECIAFWKGYLNAGGKLPPDPDGSEELYCVYHPSVEPRIKSSRTCVVVPVGNVDGIFGRLLRKLLASLVDCNYINQIYVGFDGFRPHNSLIDFLDKYDSVDFYCEERQSGPATVRNDGIQYGLSEGFDNFLLLDSDVVVEDRHLHTLIGQFLESEYPVACPRIFAHGIQWFDYYHDLNGSLNGRYLSINNLDQLLFGTTCCMLLDRSVFDHGLFFSNEFDKAAGEDISFCLSLLKRGFKINAFDNIPIMHWYGYDENINLNIQNLQKRFERYGYGEVFVLKQHPDFYSLLDRSIERSSILSPFSTESPGDYNLSR